MENNKFFKSTLYGLLFLFTLSVNAQDGANFPDAFVGIYKGNLNITSAKGNQQLPMELHLLKTDKQQVYQYTIVYDVPENRQERKYNLIAKDAEQGVYEIDENNGIVLQAKYHQGVLYSLYEVQENLLITTLRFLNDTIEFEITFSNKKQLQNSGGSNENVPLVTSYPITVVQRAKLQKQ